MNLPDANIGKRLHDVRFGNNFMNATPKTQTRTTITTGLHQTKMLLLSKRNNR